ncbi:MAG: molybdate ABC transporter substrate-binding protein [Pseudomonadales bacterium]|nr:molybdate ABC transporter substrate-binding protein [Pseudomonadales bacterium]
MKLHLRFLLTILLCLNGNPAQAENLTVAVAANFSPTLEKVVELYFRERSVFVRVSTASTGMIFAQLINGAPYDVFLAADVERPLKLEQRGLTRLRFTYAVGQPVLWAPRSTRPINETWLKDFRGRLAIANPDLAPYGTAAKEALDYFGAEPGQLVRGASVAQAFQFVHSGNAEAGLVALSQLRTLETDVDATHYWIMPPRSHKPVEQQAVIMRSAPPAADDFAAFLRSPAVRGIIEADGYILAAP